MPNPVFCPDVCALSDVQVLRLAYSLWDFQQSLSALTFLMEECDFNAKHSILELRRFRCFESTAIISFARPFEASHGHTAIGLRAIGIQLTPEEKRIKARMMKLRRKVIAHSDEDAMRFNVQVIQPLDDSELKLPLFQFQESLFLTLEELRQFETLLKRLTQAITAALFRLAQTSPQRVEGYRVPSSV